MLSIIKQMLYNIMFYNKVYIRELRRLEPIIRLILFPIGNRHLTPLGTYCDLNPLVYGGLLRAPNLDLNSLID